MVSIPISYGSQTRKCTSEGLQWLRLRPSNDVSDGTGRGGGGLIVVGFCKAAVKGSQDITILSSAMWD